MSDSSINTKNIYKPVGVRVQKNKDYYPFNNCIVNNINSVIANFSRGLCSGVRLVSCLSNIMVEGGFESLDYDVRVGMFALFQLSQLDHRSGRS